MRIYIAGPLGFSEVGRAFYYDKFIPLVEQLGHQVIDPWKLSDQKKIEAVTKMSYGQSKREVWQNLNIEIGGNNKAAIDRCDALISILDGTDVDSGTASEIGYAFAKSKPILGYRGDFRLSADNEGSTVNLQVEYFIRQSGGDIITKISDLQHGIELIEAAVQKSDPKD